MTCKANLASLKIDHLWFLPHTIITVVTKWFSLKNSLYIYLLKYYHKEYISLFIYSCIYIHMDTQIIIFVYVTIVSYMLKFDWWQASSNWLLILLTNRYQFLYTFSLSNKTSCSRIISFFSCTSKEELGDFSWSILFFEVHSLITLIDTIFSLLHYPLRGQNLKTERYTFMSR